MSLGWLRRSSRAVAAIVLLASMWQLPHRLQDDEICAPAAAEAHDESKHVYTAPSHAADQDHCAICHWTRWMKPVFSSAALPRGVDDGGTHFLLSTGDVCRDPSADQLPPRAPPSARL